MNNLSKNRVWAARIIAVSADALQIVFFPLFGEGFISFLDDILDVIVGILLTVLVGWHISFLPSFIVKVVPVIDLVPTWTIAVLIATRSNNTPTSAQQPPIEVHVEPAAPPKINAPADQ